MSVNVFKLDIYILKWVKIITAFVFILEDMKALTKSNWGLGVYLTPLKYVKPRLAGKTYFHFGWDEKLYAEQNMAGKYLNCNYENWQNITKILCRAKQDKKNVKIILI